ncbi:MAG: hypothetical protein P8012_11840 [Desulfobacterales bacterium]
MRFKDLSHLKRSEPLKIILGKMPQNILMAEYARDRAFKISEAVRTIFKKSYEWYGFTLADPAHPEFIIDIGLPKNDMNLQDYTILSSNRIAEFHESMPKNRIINGWIHSHGALNYKHFSTIDDKNNRTVLDFVAGGTRVTLAKKEVPIQNLVLLEKDRFVEKDLEKGTVSLITDKPITEAKIMETVYGSFCFSIVIGDEGWHEQQILYRERSILSAHTTVWRKSADMEFVNNQRTLSSEEIHAIGAEVKEKIQPNLNPPPELIERM